MNIPDRLSSLGSEMLVLENIDAKCEGVTELISYILTTRNITHVARVGILECPVSGDIIAPHCWIEIEGFIIDLRVREWLGQREELPHGIFHEKDYEKFVWYQHWGKTITPTKDYQLALDLSEDLLPEFL